MRKILLLITSLFLFFFTKAQTYESPIASKQSHPELKITEIKITKQNTIISLEVTNKRNAGGWFCASSDIFLRNSKGTESYHLTKSENIPTCPDQHKFSSVGEKLLFKLYFPPIDSNIKFADLIENCSNACFSFHGIILDNEHNTKIRAFEKGFELYQDKDFKEAISYFEEVIEGNTTIESHIYGLSYYYLILIYYELGNTEKVEIWYEKLVSTNLKDKDTFIKELEKLNIKQ